MKKLNKRILNNAKNVLAIELMAATQAIDLRVSNEKLGKGTKIAYKKVREKIDKLEEDRIMNLDINKSASLIEENVIVKAVEEKIGRLD
jgi:histidine ammonia-lyase